jgi:hypothetical protein
MTENLTPNKHHENEEVYAKVHPNVKLIVRRYIDRVYYCKIASAPERKELVYYERELMDKPQVA